MKNGETRFSCAARSLPQLVFTTDRPSISRITNPVNSIFQFAAPAFAGFMFDINGSYVTAMIIACSGALIGTVVILFCKPPQPVRDAANM